MFWNNFKSKKVDKEIEEISKQKRQLQYNLFKYYFTIIADGRATIRAYQAMGVPEWHFTRLQDCIERCTIEYRMLEKELGLEYHSTFI